MKTMLLLHQTVAMLCSWHGSRAALEYLTWIPIHYFFTDTLCMYGWMDACKVTFLKGAFTHAVLGGDHLFTILSYVLFPL